MLFVLVVRPHDWQLLVRPLSENLRQFKHITIKYCLRHVVRGALILFLSCVTIVFSPPAEPGSWTELVRFAEHETSLSAVLKENVPLHSSAFSACSHRKALFFGKNIFIISKKSLKK